ncbi:MAG: hypothetical protein NTAFB05_06990 [Nitrobacter sp.]|uniref:hypothetical protein n=1 Tax=Nitrobacter sp. TaxID=29420 RepID=UPI00387DF9DC
MSVLLIVGIGVLVAGLVTTAFGVPVKEFSFGNTLILSGAVVSCTGLIMISLSLVVRELRAVADRIADRLRSETMAVDRRVSVPPDTGIDGNRQPRRTVDQAAPYPGIETNPGFDPTLTPPVPSPPRQAEVSARDRAAAGAAPDVMAELPASSDTSSQPKPRRNLLFASSMRKDRERSEAERSGAAGLSPPVPATYAADLGMPRPPSFDDAWPRPEQGRASPAPLSAGSQADRLSGLHGRNASAVTVLKSGVVDGLAYSLFSDGTIEAQLPEGMMRFASIDQLRAHLDRGPDRSPSK